LIFWATVFRFHSFVFWWRSNNEVDGKVSFESSVLGFENAAFVVELWTRWFHTCPDGLEMAIPKERVKVAVWSDVVA
jgi:hypothetical protein